MKKEDKQVMRALVMITQVGITMMTPVFLCLAIGYYLDRFFSTSYITVILLFLGILSSFRCLFLLVKGFYKDDLEKEKKKQQYFDDLYDSNKKGRR